MDTSPHISRRRALGLGLGVVGVLTVSPSALASATVSGATDPCLGDGSGLTGYCNGPSNPKDEPNLGGLGLGSSVNLISNGSLEDGVPGATAPKWIFVAPAG
jgi:hypothetical protein